MAVDLSQFHQVFFEESFESLDTMESSLMELDTHAIDGEIINQIFRAAHSIKGGAGTFGFNDVTEFTHVLETLLDEVRSGKRGVSQEDLDLYLQSVDCIRGMLTGLQRNEPARLDNVRALQQAFEKILAAAPTALHNTPSAVAGTAATAKINPTGQTGAPRVNHWRIDFTPGPNILRTGNEPLRMFRELRELGPVQVNARLDYLPNFESMHPEQSYLAWELVLNAPVEREEVERIFEWVVDEAALTIAPIGQHAVAEPQTDKPASARAPEQSNITTVPVTGESATNETTSRRPAAKTSSDAGARETNSIRVAIDKIDNLINMVGELVITQSMLGQIGTNFSSAQLPRLLEGLGQLEHNTRELQESVMRIRMLPISFAFSRFPRMVRDLGRRLGKQIDLVVMGEQTELDKTVMERIGDPLVHLVRNAVDHGIELPRERKQAGKSETGKIILNAYHQSGNVVIEVIDDGKGLSREKLLEKAMSQNLVAEVEANGMTDAQVFDLIFHPGLSTAQQVSEVSGRGVGMDVVKRNIQELNGTVEIRSEINAGTTITVRLPLTLAILDGQLVRVGTHTYIFPLVSIVESLQIDDKELNRVAGGCDVFKLRHEYVPVIKLHDVFSVKPDSYRLSDSLLVVVESDGDKVGIVVDELAAQQQVVIKSLEQNYRRVEGVSGATILGDGTVSLILDVQGIVQLAGVRHVQADAANRRAAGVH